MKNLFIRFKFSDKLKKNSKELQKIMMKNKKSVSIVEIKNFFLSLQKRICSTLEEIDGTGKFIEEKWKRKGGGGGTTKVLQNGNPPDHSRAGVFEKGGVNFSAVHGTLPEKISLGIDLPTGNFFATGISLVIHPSHPLVPIIHMNLRYFEVKNQKSKVKNWFGGGIDLTPTYVDGTQTKFFHQQLKKVCDRFQKNYYPEFKKWADEYFFIKHRNEMRGIGGIFFDYLSETKNISLKDRFEFVKVVGEAFIPIYAALVERNRYKQFTERQKEFQLLRRSRYAEFNLVYDRGTKFGLETGGRTESILMSLPPVAKWVYDFKPEPNSEEERTMKLLRKGIRWV